MYLHIHNVEIENKCKRKYWKWLFGEISGSKRNILIYNQKLVQNFQKIWRNPTFWSIEYTHSQFCTKYITTRKRKLMGVFRIKNSTTKLSQETFSKCSVQNKHIGKISEMLKISTEFVLHFLSTLWQIWAIILFNSSFILLERNCSNADLIYCLFCYREVANWKIEKLGFIQNTLCSEESTDENV